jgi:hypothetical protein
MPEKNAEKELTMDELKDISGGNRAQGGGYKAKGKDKGSSNKSKSETMIGVHGVDEIGVTSNPDVEKFNKTSFA